MNETHMDENDYSAEYRAATDLMIKEMVGNGRRKVILEQALGNVSLADYIREKLKFGESIQEDAFKELRGILPPPIDTREHDAHFIADPNPDYNAEDKLKQEFIPVIPKRIEDYIRLRTLKVIDVDNQIIDSIDQRPAEIDRLVQTIITSSEPTVWKGQQTADIGPFIRDTAALEILSLCEPVTISVHGKQKWALKIPPELRKEYEVYRELYQKEMVDEVASTEYGVGAQIPRDYIVVANDDINAEISSHVLSDETLFSYFLINKIGSAQLTLRNRLENQFNKTVEQYADRVGRIIQEINDPIRIDFFHKLQEDAEKQDIELSIIARSDNDSASFQGEERRFEDEESGGYRYKISSTKPGELTFTASNDESASRLNVSVRELDGVLIYTNNETRGSQQESDDPAVEEVRAIFRQINIVTMLDWLQYGEKQRQGLEQIAKVLHQCNSCTEFMQKLQEFGKGSFPTIQFILNPGGKVNIQLERSKPPVSTTTRWN